MKSIITTLIAIILASSLCLMCTAAIAEDAPVDYAQLLMDMAETWMTGAGPEKIDADVEAMNDEVAAAVADQWKTVWLDPDYRLFMYGTDDPSELPITGKHAFVVLGFQLQNGEMADELKGRCDAAATAAKAFPDSILVCSGGETGENNPDRHTEAGLMKAYLTDVCGIAPERIFTDEKAMSTEENALNTFAILQEQGVETITIVTSGYHQRRGQSLYNAVAALYRQENGYSVEIAGNFCYDIESDMDKTQDMAIGILQMASILRVPEEKIEIMKEQFQAGLKRLG